MASSNTKAYNVSDQKLILSKQIHSGSYSSSLMLLKDYLMDDLSSCSSNGFKSFPRRPCCTTASFLIDKDLHLKPRQPAATKRVVKLKQRRSTNVTCTTLSALQKVSEAVISAVKLLQLPSSKSSVSSALSVQSKARKSFLPRSFSRKLLKKSFWRKTIKEEEKEEDGDETRQWRLFRDFLEERDNSSDQNTQPKSARVVVVVGGSSVSTSSSSGSTDSHSDSNSDSWAESEYTSEILHSSNGHSESSSENDVVEIREDDVTLKKVSNIVGAAVGDDSTADSTITKEWTNEEKEQFSPVSVLDCLFDDEDDDMASSYHSKLSRLEGTKNKLMQKGTRRFEKKLDFLEPVDLKKRMALSEVEERQDELSLDLCSPRRKFVRDEENNCENMLEERPERNQLEQRARDLHGLFMNRASPLNYSMATKADNLLFDFFQDSLKKDANEQECLKVAEDWLAGRQQELYLGWEVTEGRKTYMKEMERSGEWKKCQEEKEEIGLDLEMDVLSSLIDELVFLIL